MGSKGIEKQRRKAAIKRAKAVVKQVKQARVSASGQISEALASPPQWSDDPRRLLRVDDDLVLSEFDRAGTPGWEAGKSAGKDFMKARGKQMADLQERLFAQGKDGARDSVLVIVQGLDTAGKGGVARHVISMVDPQGIHLKAFKAPSEAERREHFLDRVKRELPPAGFIGLFDRSQYEDLLVPTAQAKTGHPDEAGHSWTVDEEVLNSRYHDIYEMERIAVEGGMRVLKFCLMVSYREQGKRLMGRLERSDKHWKFSPHDLDVRDDWGSYQQAYEEVLRRTSTQIAPWYLIPADRKWYARLAITEIITRTLEDINPAWPAADFDVEANKARLALTMTDEAISAHR